MITVRRCWRVHTNLYSVIWICLKCSWYDHELKDRLSVFIRSAYILKPEVRTRKASVLYCTPVILLQDAYLRLWLEDFNIFNFQCFTIFSIAHNISDIIIYYVSIAIAKLL